MVMSLIMSRRCAFTLAKRAVAPIARRGCIEAMNKVDGSHGGKLSNNIKLGLIQLSSISSSSSSSRFFSSSSGSDDDDTLEYKRVRLNKDTRDFELHNNIGKMFDHKRTAASKTVTIDPFTIHTEAPGYLSLKRRYKKEEISVHVCKYALDSGNDILPLNIEICKAGSSLDFNVNAHTDKLEIIHGVMTSKDAINALPPSLEEDPKIKRHFIEYLDIRDINASMINKLRDHKDSILHGKTDGDKDSLDWLQRFKEFMQD